MLSLLGFLLILAPLVVVHELGHFLFAKLFNVKAEVFSIGFGPKIWARKFGETEWRVSAVPLGGFVKLLGEDRDAPLPPEEAKRALHNQGRWKRFFIFFGGPLFNFLFAIIVFVAILAIGDPQVSSRILRVVETSEAARAGFKAGDLITAINGEPVTRFEEVNQRIQDGAGQELRFTVERAGASGPVELAGKPVLRPGMTMYGEMKPLGDIDGLSPVARSARLGISDPASAAAKAGLRAGDLLTSLNGSPVASWEAFESGFAGLPAKAPFTLGWKRGEATGGESGTATLRKGAAGMEAGELGLWSSELFVERTVEKAPAALAGLLPGDRLISVAGREVFSFAELRMRIQESGERDGKVRLAWQRAGQLMEAELAPTATEQRDPALRKTTQFTVGVVPKLETLEPEMIVERVWNPFVLLYRGTERMAVMTYRNFVSIKKMFTGDVSMGTLGGPIMIGMIAGESISRGLIAFLTTMAMLSIGLGVLNILPVPVLDGGHILLLGVEAIRRRPLSLRQLEVVQGVGLTLILLLMVVVLRNDLTRLTAPWLK